MFQNVDPSLSITKFYNNPYLSILDIDTHKR